MEFMSDDRPVFAGSIPETYDRYLGPVVFKPFAQDLVARLPTSGAGTLLEIACGTGIVTEQLVEHLPEGWEITATDISESMLSYAKTKGRYRDRVTWQVADALSLPFPDGSFNIVVCQFGMMFFPDKPAAVREIHRVLKPHGTFLFNVWESLNRNEPFDIGNQVQNEAFAPDAPQFFQIPFSMGDPHELRELMQVPRFQDISVENVSRTGVSPSAHDLAVGINKGTPVLMAMLDKNPSKVEPLTLELERRLKERYGNGRVYTNLRALVCSGRKLG